MEEQLSKSEKKQLKKLQRPSLILAISLFIGITTFNLIIYYHDIVTGIEGLERPPLSQLIIIEVAAGIIGFITYYFLSKKTIKDLSNGKKQIEQLAVTFKFVKNENGQPAYSLKLKNALVVIVNPSLFKTINVGDQVQVEYASETSHIFNVSKVA